MRAPHRTTVPAVGFVTPPRWVSPSMPVFPAVAAAPVIPQHCIPDLPGFCSSLDEIVPATDAVLAASLGEAGCSVVALEGTPFAWAGCDGEDAARSRAAPVAAVAGAPAVSAATAIVDALRALDVRPVALCPTYDPSDRRDAWNCFVASCGIDVSSGRTTDDEGIAGPTFDADTCGCDTGPDLIAASVERAIAASPDADAVVVTGAGCRTTPIIAVLERLAGRSVVGADSASFRAAAGAADITLRPGSPGALTGAGGR